MARSGGSITWSHWWAVFHILEIVDDIIKRAHHFALKLVGDFLGSAITQITQGFFRKERIATSHGGCSVVQVVEVIWLDLLFADESKMRSQYNFSPEGRCGLQAFFKVINVMQDIEPLISQFLHLIFRQNNFSTSGSFKSSEDYICEYMLIERRCYKPAVGERVFETNNIVRRIEPRPVEFLNLPGHRLLELAR